MVLVFAILIIISLISESLIKIGNTPYNCNSGKVSRHLFNLFFYIILMFVVSHVNYYMFMSLSIPKMATVAVYLISSA